MNVINCSVDIKADWYTSFFFMFSYTSTTDILKNLGNQRWRIIREDPFWSEKDGGYVTLFYFIIPTHYHILDVHYTCMYVQHFFFKTYLLLWLRQAWQFKKNIAIVWETSVNKSKLSSRKIYETFSLWDMLMD